MRTLGIDIESYSSVDLADAGVYRYAESDDFEVLLIGYSFDGGPVEVHDCTQPGCWPRELLAALVDPSIVKTAWNAQFERTCLAAALEEEMPPEQWSDTMVLALECGLPGSLAAAGAALGLPEDKLKDPVGKALIAYFSKPCKPTRANGMRTRNLPAHDPDRWKLYIEYNRQDVVTEMEIRKHLYQLHPSEQRLWCLDQQLNDHGVMIDVPMVEKIVAHDKANRERLAEEARELTGLKNPNSLQQLKGWLAQNGAPVDQLRKDDIDHMLELNLMPKVHRVLEIRKALGKTSTAKYSAMLDAVCSDGRLRGILQFYGANRSGRWAGRLVQTHNLARNTLPDLDLARELAVAGDFDTMEALFGETPFVLSELIRTAFIPEPGNRFIVSDFSAIEARVIAWLAGEQWVLEAFRAGKDIYCETASQMYHVPVVKHGVNGELRQKGKIATLACIAEGQKVLTDVGLVPIEQVTADMKVWDGVEWVHHEGVVYKGEKEVIQYGGLEATADHIVWAEVDGKYRQIRFGDAAAGGARLVQSGAGREAVRLAPDHLTGAEVPEGLVAVHGADRVHRMRAEVLDVTVQHDAGQDQRLPELQPAEGRASLAGPEIHGGEAEMREPGRSAVQELWRAGDPLRVSERDGRLPLHDRDERTPGQEAGDRPDRQRRELRSRESQMGNTERAEREQARKQEVRVYDILNAGPRHRFTVSGVLVHNCGYQGGVGAMKAMDSSGSIPEEEMQGIVDQWRAANPKIVKLWRDYETAARTAIQERRAVRRAHNVIFSYLSGNLLVQLPSGRSICYWGARIRQDDRTGREQIVYQGVNQTTKQWQETETYGGKLVENVVQATARDCLATAMTRVADMGYQIVMHVHDELIADVPVEDWTAVPRITEAMSTEIPWALGLPLKGETYETEFYRKD